MITAVLLIANQPAHGANAASKTVVVTMTDKPPTYVPAKLAVKVRTTILWKNSGATLHDVTTDSSVVQDKTDVALPFGAKPFDSGFMALGASWSYTLRVPGRYVYMRRVPLLHEKPIAFVPIAQPPIARAPQPVERFAQPLERAQEPVGRSYTSRAKEQRRLAR